jgi:hypothetical protein
MNAAGCDLMGLRNTVNRVAFQPTLESITVDLIPDVTFAKATASFRPRYREYGLHAVQHYRCACLNVVLSREARCIQPSAPGKLPDLTGGMMHKRLDYRKPNRVQNPVSRLSMLFTLPRGNHDVVLQAHRGRNAIGCRATRVRALSEF